MTIVTFVLCSTTVIHQELANDILELNDDSNFGRVAFHAHVPIFNRYNHANYIIINMIA